MRVGEGGNVPLIHAGSFDARLEEPAMFRQPAYDPIGIAMLGLGIMAVAALATFVY
jgi:hypothetical protein